MNKGVELLLKRMDSNPEEFEDRYHHYSEPNEGKWDSIINQLMHRVEVIDRDNGHASANHGVRVARYGKPLGYLTDDEVLTLLGKLDETRAMLFERRVMRTLLTDDQREKIYAGAADLGHPTEVSF